LPLSEKHNLLVGAAPMGNSSSSSFDKNPELDVPIVVKEGPLNKRNEHLGGKQLWEPRFFRLTTRNLYYWTGSGSPADGTPPKKWFALLRGHCAASTSRKAVE
jgi:hypothetical protein